MKPDHRLPSPLATSSAFRPDISRASSASSQTSNSLLAQHAFQERVPSFSAGSDQGRTTLPGLSQIAALAATPQHRLVRTRKDVPGQEADTPFQIIFGHSCSYGLPSDTVTHPNTRHSRQRSGKCGTQCYERLATSSGASPRPSSRQSWRRPRNLPSATFMFLSIKTSPVFYTNISHLGASWLRPYLRARLIRYRSNSPSVRIVRHQRRHYGDATSKVQSFAMPAVSSSNCTVDLDRSVSRQM